jgi:predicted Zn-dependent peptidase
MRNELITYYKPGKSTVVQSVVGVGSRLEPKHLKGISHFVEHLCFKGTTKYAQGKIEEIVENYGGDLNACTDYDSTLYYIRVPSDYRLKALDMIKEMMSNVKFDPKEVEKERQVILQEIKMYADHTPSYTGDVANTALFSSDSGLYDGIAGSIETVSRITIQDLENWYDQYYRSGFPQILVVGGTCITYIPKHLPDYDLRTFSEKIYHKIKIVTRKDISQSCLVLTGFIDRKTYKDRLKTSCTSDVLSNVLNGMSGRLFKEIREKRGFVYGIRFGFQMFINGDIGWTVSCELEQKNIQKAVKIIKQELIRPVTNEEVKNAIISTTGKLDLSLENTRKIADVISRAILMGYNPATVITDISKGLKVSPIEVHYIQRLLNPKKASIAILNPSK